MRLVILQPSYMPWLGYFDQMVKSDVFVLYDDVQYDKHGWRNRNRIKTPKGPQWLTVPVLTKSRNLPLNNEVEINHTVSWQAKHLRSISQNYAKAPFFNTYIGTFEDLFKKEWRLLIDLNIALIHALMEQLRLRTKVILSSTLKIPIMDRTERLVAICQALGADTLLEGDSGKNYMNESIFEENGIHISYHQYEHPVYHQLHGDFIPYLSVLDLLLNEGDNSLNILHHRE